MSGTKRPREDDGDGPPAKRPSGLRTMRVVNYAPLFDRADERNKRKAAEIASTKSFKRKADALVGEAVRDTVPGDKYLRELERCLSTLEPVPGKGRSGAQVAFHRAMINATLPHIYGSDFKKFRERIMVERAMTEMSQEVLICCPRRFGKTTSVSMFIAAFLYCVPDAWISCFSTGQRASTTLLDQAARYFALLPGSKDMLLKKNQEQFFVKGKDASDVRRFHSFPSSVAGLKGQGGKIIILEEASRLDEAVFNEVVLPLMGVDDTSLVAISTPLEESNFFSQLLLMKKPNGAPLFLNLQIVLMCEECRAADLDSCPHMAKNLPDWKSEGRAQMVKELMSGNKDMWQREQNGVITTRDTCAFDRPSVERFFARRCPLASFVPQDDRVYISIDPAGGGFSNTALVAGAMDANSKLFVVLAADARAVTCDEELEVFLKSFLESMRCQNQLSSSLFVLIIERNFGGSVMASRIANIVATFPPLKVLSADDTKHRRMGTVTTDLVKERARVDLQRLLRMDIACLTCDSDFISNKRGIIGELRSQLLAFKFQTVEKGEKTRTILSGKTFGGNDDLCMAFLLLVYWSAYSLATPGCLM